MRHGILNLVWGNEFSDSMLETGLSLNRVTTVREQMLEGLRS